MRAKTSIKPSSPAASRRMAANRGRDTTPERTLRSLLHRGGLRFRVNCPPVEGLRTRADIVFRTRRIAIYVDGCFWHGCPLHGTLPKANGILWRHKLRENVRRDERVTNALTSMNWTVVRIWEHESMKSAAQRIMRLVRSRNPFRSNAAR